MALLPNSRPFGCSTLAFCSLVWRLSSPPLPFRGRRPFFGSWTLLEMPSLFFFQLFPFSVPFHNRWEGFVVSGSHPFVIPVCFGCCSPWESTQLALKRFSGRHPLCGVCGSCLAPSCWSGCFPWPRLFPHAASDGFLSSDSFWFPFRVDFFPPRVFSALLGVGWSSCPNCFVCFLSFRVFNFVFQTLPLVGTRDPWLSSEMGLNCFH